MLIVWVGLLYFRLCFCCAMILLFVLIVWCDCLKCFIYRFVCLLPIWGLFSYLFCFVAYCVDYLLVSLLIVSVVLNFYFSFLCDVFSLGLFVCVCYCVGFDLVVNMIVVFGRFGFIVTMIVLRWNGYYLFKPRLCVFIAWFCLVWLGSFVLCFFGFCWLTWYWCLILCCVLCY